MVRFLYRRCQQAKWLEPPEDEYGIIDGGTSNLGVLLRRKDGVYTGEPMFLNEDLVRAAERLSLPVAFTMSSEITQALLNQITPFQTEVSLDPRGFVLPIVNSVKDLATGRSNVTREAYVCLCRNERMVFVWGDSVQGILPHATDVETKLLGLVWGSHIVNPSVPTSFRHSNTTASSSPGYGRHSVLPLGAPGNLTPVDAVVSEKVNVIQTAIEKEEHGHKYHDPEKDGNEVPKRPFLLTHAVIIGLAMILVVVVEMACIAKVSARTVRI